MANDGGPAFPYVPGDYGLHNDYFGMSLRDWYAGMALSGLCIGSFVEGGNIIATRRAEQAYKIADAMIAQREKHDGKVA